MAEVFSYIIKKLSHFRHSPLPPMRQGETKAKAKSVILALICGVFTTLIAIVTVTN